MNDNLPARSREARKAALALIARASDANRPYLEGRLARLQMAPGRDGQAMKWGTIYHRLRALAHLDRVIAPRTFNQATPDDVFRCVSAFAPKHARTTTHQLCIGFSSELKALLRIRKGERLPWEWQEVLVLDRVSAPDNSVILTDAEFRGLLLAANTPPPQYRYTYWTMLAQAMLWLLWEGGLRISEALSLNLRDIEVHADGGCTAHLSATAYESGAGDLKTGARSIYLVETAPALKALMAVVPDQEPSAPLFQWRFAASDESGRWAYASFAERTLDRVVKNAGLLSTRGSDFTLSPHDFRHTCATRKANLGWNEFLLRQYFGWSPDSDMPSKYVKRANLAVRDRIRSDLGLDATGAAPTADVADFEARIARALRKLLDAPKGVTNLQPGD